MDKIKINIINYLWLFNEKYKSNYNILISVVWCLEWLTVTDFYFVYMFLCVSCFIDIHFYMFCIFFYIFMLAFYGAVFIQYFEIALIFVIISVYSIKEFKSSYFSWKLIFLVLIIEMFKHNKRWIKIKLKLDQNKQIAKNIIA